MFPAFYGLLVYFTIRLLHDIDVEYRFWNRDLDLNIFEITCSVVLGYLSVYLFKKLFRFYDKHWLLQLTSRGVLKELTILILANLVLVHLALIPMAAYTDDGLSLADFVDLTTIPTLYAIIYYGIARSETWLKAYVDNKVQLEKVSNEHLLTELKFLKAQYHPHFLFNALNTIYFQMDEDVTGAKRTIEKISELLRYQLYDQHKKVPVSNEIAYLESFIELQKIRSTNKLTLETSFDELLNGQLVYPLLFLPLVENAFKFIGGDYRMLIYAELDKNYIKFSIENSVSLMGKSETKTGGIGLENLKRRLVLLYPDKHFLKLEEKEYRFKVELKLQYE